MDWPSGCSERHLSFILRNLLSLDEVVFDEDRQKARAEARQIQEKGKEDLGDILQQIEPVSKGCEAEHLNLPHKYIATMKDEEMKNFDVGYDWDYMMVFKKLVLGETVGDATEPEEAVCLMEPAGSPGYLKIRVPDIDKVEKMFHPFIAKDRPDGKFYILGEETVSTLTKAMMKDNRKLDLAVVKEPTPSSVGLDDVDGAESNKSKVNVSVTENTFSVPCPSWPSAASAFLIRRRVAQWPPDELIENINTAGCHAVPFPHPDSNDPKIEWRLSFDVAEKLLADSLTQPQRRCFLILQGLLKVHLELPPVLTSSHLKTVLFWCLEDKPVETWGDECLAPSFFFLIDKLIFFLVRKDIPNFFIPKNNMISHIHRDFVDDILQKVIAIRHDPIPYLRQMHDELQSPEWIPFDTIFAPIVCAIQDDPFYPGEDCIRHSLMNIGFGLSALGEKRFALPYLSRCVRTVTVEEGDSNPVYSIDTGLTQMIHHTALEVDDLDTAIRYMMFLMDVIGDVPAEDAETVFDLPSILCNLGCLIHAKYHQETSSELKELLLAKAENFLLRSIASGLPSAYLEYANLLCRTNREHDAVFYLQKAASTSGPEALVQYGQIEKYNVDENLREQIEIYGHVTLPSAVYATHQLVMINHNRGLKTEAREHLAELEKLVAVPLVRKQSDSTDMLEGIDEVDREAERRAEGQRVDDIKLEMTDTVDGKEDIGKETKGTEASDVDEPDVADHELYIQNNIQKSMSHIMTHAYKVVGVSGDGIDVKKGGDGGSGDWTPIMPPKFKYSLSMLDSKLFPVLQKHLEKLQELKHIYDESKNCFSDVEQKLKRLADSGEGMTTILSEGDKKFIESTLTYKRRPVSIFMGQRNCGKSTLVNEILRKSCLPTHENPCTARMVRLTYGSPPMASLIDKDGTVIEEVPCKKQKVPSELVNLSEERRRDIAEVRKLVLAEIDLPVLECGVDFIDSPGFGENMILDQVIEEFIQDDIEPVIVYVINGKEMLRTQDIEAILHLKQTFPLIPIIFVLNKTDIDIEALRHDMEDTSDDEQETEDEERIEQSIREQKRLISERVMAIFEKLKKPCPDSDLTFLPKGAKFGDCDYFHTVSSLRFRLARFAKNTDPTESNYHHIDSFLRFEESFVNVFNQNLVVMDEKLVTCIRVYLQGMSSVMGRARCGIHEAVENLPLLTRIADESELQMRDLLKKIIDTSLGDRKLFEKAVKTKDIKNLLLFQWTQIREASTDMVRFMCSANSISLMEYFGIDEEDLELEIAPSSGIEKNVQRLWYVTEARNLVVAKLSEMVNDYVVSESSTTINGLLDLFLECQKTLRDPYIKLLLKRAYCINSDNARNKRGGSFSTMMISTAAFGMFKSINKGIVEGIEEELKKLYKCSDLKKLLPGPMMAGRKKWHEQFADNLIEYLVRSSRRISKLICDHASKELELMHVVFKMHIRRLESLADDFKKQGRDELLEIGKQFCPRIFLLTLRAHAILCQFKRGSILLGDKVNVGKDGSVHRCSDDMCGWCFDQVDGLYHRPVVARVVHLDTMTDEKRARYVRDLVYLIELAEDCLDNSYLVRFYGVLMPGPSTVHILMEEMHMDLLSWLKAMPRSMSKRIRVALHVAQGVKAIHDRHLVFLDIKPTSVLIGRTGDAKLNICKPESAMAPTPLGVPFHLHKNVYSEYETGYHNQYYDMYAMGMLLWVLCEGSGTASPFPGCRDHEEMCTMQELGQIPCNPAGTPRKCSELMEKCWKEPEKLTIGNVIGVLEKELNVFM
ncbi:uncharacterized protein LOC135499333 [Lineus longissimus]|uniref:uncharacterized protein LOC135499333 n=1 Tax=Lineus longissimus TaxID=88925 RepID=UPI00315D7257